MQHDSPAHISALTSLRGLAAWWVALYHFREYLPLNSSGWLWWGIAYGYYAVDLFFILSGFVLHINYAPRLARPSREALWQFAVARFARVYPLHLAMMVAFLAIPVAIMLFSQHGLLPGQRFAAEYYVMSLLLIQNWGFLDYLAWNVPAWSISTEAGAYVLFPLLAMAVMRLRGVLAACAAFLLVLAFIGWLFWVCGMANIAADIARWGLVRCVLEFLLGMCCGRLYQLTGPPGWGRQALLLVGAGGMFGLAWLGVRDYFVLPAGFALLVMGLSAATGPVSAVLGARWLVYLGEISYATYMVHYFLREVIKFGLPDSWGASVWGAGVYISATFVASVLLYHVVEVPARDRLRRLAGPVAMEGVRGR